MFDPWESTLEDALRENKERKAFGPTAPFFQFLAAREVSDARRKVEGGDGLTIVFCIERCAMSALVAPSWLASAFHKRVSAVLMGEAVSWDDPLAFGRPHKKSTRKNSEKDRYKRAMEAWFVGSKLLERDPIPPIDAGFFEEIGENLSPPVGKTSAEEAYRLAKSIFDEANAMSEDDFFRKYFHELGESH